MKASPWPLIHAHHEGLIDDYSGARHKADYVVFYAVPGVVFAVGMVFGVSLPEGASQGLLTVAGLLSAFFFGAMLQVTERALEWAKDKPEQGADTTWQAQFLTQIAASAGYASFVSIAAAALFVVALSVEGIALTVACALGIAVMVHLVLLLVMVMNWVFKMTSRKLVAVRTGAPATVTDLPTRKASNGP